MAVVGTTLDITFQFYLAAVAQAFASHDTVFELSLHKHPLFTHTHPVNHSYRKTWLPEVPLEPTVPRKKASDSLPTFRTAPIMFCSYFIKQQKHTEMAYPK